MAASCGKGVKPPQFSKVMIIDWMNADMIWSMDVTLESLAFWGSSFKLMMVSNCNVIWLSGKSNDATPFSVFLLCLFEGEKKRGETGVKKYRAKGGLALPQVRVKRR